VAIQSEPKVTASVLPYGINDQTKRAALAAHIKNSF
jgi:hypothetical protein